MHAFAANDYAWDVQTIKYEPLLLSKKLRTEMGAYILKQEITIDAHLSKLGPYHYYPKVKTKAILS